MKPRASDGSTLLLRVFRVLKRDGSLCAALISERVGVHRHAVHTACRALIKRRKVLRHKYRRPGLLRGRVVLSGSVVIYSAVIGARPPSDLRGTRKGSRNSGLKQVVAMNRARLGNDWKPKPPQPRGHALDEAWRPAALLPDDADAYDPAP